MISGQDFDPSFFSKNKAKFLINPFIGFEYLSIDSKYKLNVPLKVGLSFVIESTWINFRIKVPIVNMKGTKCGETIAHYIRYNQFYKSIIFDAFYNYYNGFYSDKQEVEINPQMRIQQIGIESTYIFNSDKFSSAAALNFTNNQVQSVGSFLIGGGLYHYNLSYNLEVLSFEPESFDNLLVG